MRLTSDKIEQIAVNQVESIFYKSKKIHPIISKNDKEPSWDGHLYIKLNDGQKRVAIQVKGKTVKKLPKKPSYPISVTNLRNYMRDGGVIFFVVYIMEDAQYPYYVALAPIDLRRYIKIANGQATISVKLHPLPESLNEMENIVMDFHTDSNRQISFIDSKILRLEDAINERYKIHFFAHSNTETGLLTSVSNSPKYLYASIPSDSITTFYPIGEGAYDLSVFNRVTEDVIVGGRHFFKEFLIEPQNNVCRIIIGGSFSFEVNLSSLHGKLSYSSNATYLSERLNELYFLRAVYANKKISIGKMGLVLNDVKQSDIKECHKEITYFECVQALMLRLNVKEDINIKDFTENDINKVDTLIKTIIDTQEIEYPHKLARFCTINISRYVFFLLVDEVAEGRYKISNFFEEGMKLQYMYKNDEGKLFLTSPYSLVFNKPDFIEYSNIKYEEVLPSYQHMVQFNPSIYGIANNDLLKALVAYDKSRQKSEQLFKAIESLSRWLVDEAPEDKIIHIINKYQIIKRHREFSFEETQELMNLLVETNINKIEEVAIHLLLDNKTQSEICFEKLTDEEQILFMSWPISLFLKRYKRR